VLAARGAVKQARLHVPTIPKQGRQFHMGPLNHPSQGPRRIQAPRKSLLDVPSVRTFHSSPPAQAPPFDWGSIADKIHQYLLPQPAPAPKAPKAPAKRAAAPKDEPFAILPNGRGIPAEGWGDHYHGTKDVTEEELRTSGLPERGTSRDLARHVEPRSGSDDAANSAFRSATPYARSQADDGQGAVHWAGEGGLVVHYTAPYVDPGKELEGRIKGIDGKYRSALTRGEGERTTEARQPNSRIMRWGRVEDGRVQSWETNPDYVDPRKK
jgi:hypothetical protein